MESCPIEVGGDGDVSDQMLIGEDLGLEEVELGLCEGADPLREGLILSHRPAFQDVIIEGLKLIAVGEIVPEDLFAALQ